MHRLPSKALRVITMNGRIECDYGIVAPELLRSGGGLLLAASLPAIGAQAAPPKDYRVVAGPARARLAGPEHPETDVWTYNGTVPGSLVRLRQGDSVRLVVEDGLDQETTVHWDGIRLANAMDGVPGLTQPPGHTAASTGAALHELGWETGNPVHRASDVQSRHRQPPAFDRLVRIALGDLFSVG
ncbi:multicopper oxidase protein (plasmid) [Sinorhizobium fredii]|uniref:Multicopper oxidase protein n=1 Tax=Rhizobium fredii TaxID=380 RepID=A0A2L0HAW3_RHIFR|nr:multicopper oxidase protein [Sinorhizobium fredii]